MSAKPIVPTSQEVDAKASTRRRRASGRVDGGRPAAGQAQTKVLLAEDDESFVDALVIGLAREGFDVTVARDGNEALRLFAEVSPTSSCST